MVARFRSELCAARVLQRDFQRLTPDSAWIECKRRAIARSKEKAGFCWVEGVHRSIDCATARRPGLHCAK
jgi:hypothetical protein